MLKRRRRSRRSSGGHHPISGRPRRVRRRPVVGRRNAVTTCSGTGPCSRSQYVYVSPRTPTAGHPARGAAGGVVRAAAGGADSSGNPVAAYSAHSTTRAGGGAGRSGCVTSSPSTSTRPAARCCSMRSCDSPAPTSRSNTVGISARSSVIGPSCVGGPAAQGLTNSAGLAEFAGCGVPGSADPFSRPRRGATTPPNGKFGAPLPALSAASADPLARPGTGPSLYAISSSLRAIARADRQDSRGLDVQRRWPPRSAARSRRCRASSSRINASRTRRPCVPHRRRRR
jgi:hypothetical protein